MKATEESEDFDLNVHILGSNMSCAIFLASPLILLARHLLTGDIT